MNKLYLLLFFGLFLSILTCHSQTLSDSKVWNYVQKMYGHDDIERAYTVTINGDTIVNDQKCKKLVKVYQDTPNEQTVFAVYEKDSKVYQVFGSDTYLLFDYNLSVGDKVNEVGTVVSVDYIALNNNTIHKRITIAYDNNYQNYLVEGIGLSSTKYSSYELNSYYDVLVSVYENGECIFKDSDFTKQATGIDVPKSQTEGSDNSLLYDLSGKQVLVPQKGHVYIKGEKKFIF